MPRLFALDHNFPDPIVSVLAGSQPDAQLERISEIHPGMADLEDWELLVALHQHATPWDGLITTDSSMLKQGSPSSSQPPLAMIRSRRPGCSLPISAGSAKRTRPDEAQVWTLRAANRQPDAPWGCLERFAAHNNRNTDSAWHEFRLADAQLARDPLGD
ncbi:MAG: hypothetical protein JOZ07_01595 [Solirubrobacterales bacterium]|nr:hypothetical protein [Solirubrobacterales bacterium]